MTIVIATAPHMESGVVSLRHDTELVRAALLYADTVELISPTALMVGSIAALGELGPAAMAEVLAGLDDETLRARGTDPVQLRAALGVTGLSRHDRRRAFGPGAAREIRREYTELIERQQPGVDEVVNQIHVSAGAEDLELALEQGVLTLAAPGTSDRFDMDEYAETLKRLVSTPSAHLLFDQEISGLVNAMIREGVVEPHRLATTRAGEAATGAGMVQRLPAFPGSTMAAVLEAREELQDPLAQYRSATVGLAGALAAGPFDDDLQLHLDDLWRNSVEPTVEKLRRELSKTRLVRNALAGAFTDLTSWLASGAGGILTMGVADLAPLPAVLATATSTMAITAVKSRIEAKDQARDEQLYYLYELGQKLR